MYTNIEETLWDIQKYNNITNKYDIFWNTAWYTHLCDIIYVMYNVRHIYINIKNIHMYTHTNDFTHKNTAYNI